MITVKPPLVVPGVWGFETRNNPVDTAWVWDTERRVHPLESQSGVIRLGKAVGQLDGDKELYGRVSFHPIRPRWVQVVDGVVKEIDAEWELRWRHGSDIEAVMYSRTGDIVWTAGHVSKDAVKVSLFGEATGHLLADTVIPDELTVSSLRLSDIPGTDAVMLEFAAGQDGVGVWELTRDGGRILGREVFPHASYITPAWRPDATRFLSMDNDDQTYSCFSFPGLEALAAQDGASLDWDDETTLPGYEMLWLAGDTVIVQSADYRFWLFDPSTMTRRDEIVIRGWEPVPTCEIYPRLKDETALYSVIVQWGRVGDLLLAKTLDNWRNPALLVFTASGLTRQVSGAGAA